MIRRELAKDPKLATESWDRFLPKFRKHHLKTSEKTAKKNEKVAAKEEARKAADPDASTSTRKEKPAKKVYTPFPPPQQPRKVDKSLYHCFLSSADVVSRLTFSLSPENTSSSHTSVRPGKLNNENKRCVFYFCMVTGSDFIYSKLRRHLNDERNGQRHSSLLKNRQLLQLRRSESDGMQMWMAKMVPQSRKRRKRRRLLQKTPNLPNHSRATRFPPGQCCMTRG